MDATQATTLSMSAADSAQQIQMALLMKGREQLKQNGEAILKLVESVPTPTPSSPSGHRIDLYA